MGTVSSIAAARLRRALENAKKMDVVETVGAHQDCGGSIIYSSKVVPDRSRPGVFVRGRPLMKTEVRCFCAKCGARFNPDDAGVQRKLSEIFGE
jgi:hypothetical protein